MWMSVLRDSCVAAILLAPSAAATDPASQPTGPDADRERDAISSAVELERTALVRAVLERNLTLEAARRSWRVAVAREGAVSGLEQPEISYAVAPLSIGSPAVFGQEIELSQRLGRSADRQLRRDVARAEGATLAADLETARLELARAASLLFIDYELTSRAIDVNAQHVDLLEDLKQSATSRYAAGLGSQQDPLQAESELAHVLHQDVRLRSEQRIIA